MSLLVKDAIIAHPSGPFRGDLLCSGPQLVAIGRDLADPDAHVIEANGLTAGPGFIDIHVHGGGGHSFFTDDPAQIEAYAAWAPAHGVTAFLVSTLGPDHEATIHRLRALAPALTPRRGAAEPLGFHLEGPYLSPARRGAFPAHHLRRPAIAEYEALHTAAGGAIRQVTIAPELPGALPLIHTIARLGAVPALGHTDATYPEARQGFEAGIRHATHLFNAMRPIHQREGGPIVAALEEPTVSCELIFDGAHVEPAVLRLAWRLLGPNRTVIVSDNLHLAGVDAGQAVFAGETVSVHGSHARKADGTIVGSVAPFDVHVRNAIEILAIDLATAFRLASTNPARIAGASHRKGQLEPGFDADIVLLDHDLRVALTICRGQIAYRRL
ncbi:N-acetylglucosamine-6-phosphate deacetylase [Tepidiforma sp.]|uniref:N-acetylglucosamine-6-phosphate deacetylase n=1 Tax=Tepidiforma sp. TaxID=2682230 RepID=UPI002ADE103E|nr:N-acetylglucosamine-6-phosphate deacetylase [Tepidiforma sp.]